LALSPWDTIASFLKTKIHRQKLNRNRFLFLAFKETLFELVSPKG